MANKEDILGELVIKREALIDKIKKVKYSYIEITNKDKKTNELFHSKILPNFKFEEDFYFNLAMKYKSEIESNEFFEDLKYMPKGCLLHHHILDCIDIEWLSKEVIKKENLNNIYMRKFDIYDALVYTTQPIDNYIPFKKIN